MKNNKGVTLIALVVTIIVLLILAAVTISMLRGENGIIKQAQNANDATIVGKETEAVNIAYSMRKAKSNSSQVKENELKNELIKNGEKNIAVSSDKSDLIVKFNDTNHSYRIDQNGNIQKEGKINSEDNKIYAKLYTDGTLIFSSTDYTDLNKIISENYGDISKEEYYKDYEKQEIKIPNWVYFDTENDIYKNKAKSVVVYDKIYPTTTAFWFYYYSGDSLELNNIDTKNVISMESMFDQCTNLKKLDLTNFDTRKVINMKYMFNLDINITEIKISSTFDTSNVTNMQAMFTYCNKLSDMSFISDFNVDKVKDFSFMLAMNLNIDSAFSKIDISKWNISSNANINDFIIQENITIYVKDETIKNSIKNICGTNLNCIVKN